MLLDWQKGWPRGARATSVVFAVPHSVGRLYIYSKGPIYPYMQHSCSYEQLPRFEWGSWVTFKVTHKWPTAVGHFAVQAKCSWNVTKNYKQHLGSLGVLSLVWQMVTLTYNKNIFPLNRFQIPTQQICVLFAPPGLRQNETVEWDVHHSPPSVATIHHHSPPFTSKRLSSHWLALPAALAWSSESGLSPIHGKWHADMPLSVYFDDPFPNFLDCVQIKIWNKSWIEYLFKPRTFAQHNNHTTRSQKMPYVVGN